MSLYLTLESSDKCETAKKAEKKCTDGRKHCSKNPCSIEENAVINEHFNFNIQSGILPGRSYDRGSQEKIQDSRDQKMVGYKG